MIEKRIGMVVPSLNTIAEDDFRRFIPDGVGYHVHRIRLRKEPGRVTMDDLARSYGEAEDETRVLGDLRPAAIVFNCTGASVACGEHGDAALAERMSASIGVPSTNTMVAIKEALRSLRVTTIVHVCPFADEFSEIERKSLVADGFEVLRSVGLGFTDAREAAQMTPERMTEIALAHDTPDADGILLSCANVRAFEAVDALEQRIGKPVVTSNQAVLWSVLRLAGWAGAIPGAGRLFNA